MTDERAQESGSEKSGDESSAAGAASNMGSEVTAMFSKLSGGERLAVLGGLIVVVGWLIFDLLVDRYSTSSVNLALGILIVGAAFVHHRRTAGADPVPYGSVLFVAAGILGILGAAEVIEEVRDNIFDASGTTVFGAIVFYVGSIMAGVGAVQLRGK